MAKRPVFVPEGQAVRELSVEFQWFPGFAVAQARKSIAALHEAAKVVGIDPVLEISSKSPDPVGVALSAFNLMVEIGGRRMPVESAFQGAKRFRDGGPFPDIFEKSGREAKRDPRLKEHGPLVGFLIDRDVFPLEPKTAFYDHVYLLALGQNPELAAHLLQFNGFTDIAFDPKKSLNCQARSAALFVARASGSGPE